jgi:hypothetical protein
MSYNELVDMATGYTNFMRQRVFLSKMCRRKQTGIIKELKGMCSSGL